MNHHRLNRRKKYMYNEFFARSSLLLNALPIGPLNKRLTYIHYQPSVKGRIYIFLIPFNFYYTFWFWFFFVFISFSFFLYARCQMNEQKQQRKKFAFFFRWICLKSKTKTKNNCYFYSVISYLT